MQNSSLTGKNPEPSSFQTCMRQVMCCLFCKCRYVQRPLRSKSCVGGETRKDTVKGENLGKKLNKTVWVKKKKKKIQQGLKNVSEIFHVKVDKIVSIAFNTFFFFPKALAFTICHILTVHMCKNCSNFLPMRFQADTLRLTTAVLLV